jgi:DNA-binding NtrC family response regulator
MRYPRVLVCAPDDALEHDLRPVAEERRWVVTSFRRAESLFEAIDSGSPTVVLLQVEPLVDSPDSLSVIPQLVERWPDIAIIVVSDGKIPEDERPNWLAVVMSIGASYVLFPPITATVFEDLISGFILSRGGSSRVKNPLDTETIDLAEEGQAEN